MKHAPRPDGDLHLKPTRRKQPGEQPNPKLDQAACVLFY
jgi:hypothetical protein